MYTIFASLSKAGQRKASKRASPPSQGPDLQPRGEYIRMIARTEQTKRPGTCRQADPDLQKTQILNRKMRDLR
jgi:hypothetical protein